jgi:alpha-tubulin suppressor-like RCC1 family protein
VPSGVTLPLSPGRYNNITVNGVLNLTGGLYEARSLSINNDSRVVAQGRSVVRLLTGVSALDRSRIVTAAGLNASDLTIEASGGLATNATLGVSLGNDAQLTALVVASRGLRAGDRLLASGAIAAQNVTAGFNTSLTFQGGFACSTDADCGGGGSCSGMCVDAQCQMPASCSAVAIAPGSDHACAVLADGTASCWGDNGPGDAGHGDVDAGGFPAFPQKVAPGPVVTDLVGTKLTNVRAIDVGGSTSCAVLNDGSVWCWGFVPSGLSNFAVQIPGFTNATSIALGTGAVCALLSNGGVSCLSGGVPTAVPIGPVGATAIVTAASYFCALLTDHTVRCWGDDTNGVLGDGMSGPSQPAPGVLVPGITTAVAITASEGAACAVLSSGAVKCWGNNQYGEIGNNTTPSSQIYGPTTVFGLSDAVSIGSGINHVCAVRAGGTIQCWGQGGYGQLGYGDTLALNAPSATHSVSGLTSATQVGGATNFSCAVVRDGRAFCWGADNDANLGDGSGDLPNKLTPVRVQF